MTETPVCFSIVLALLAIACRQAPPKQAAPPSETPQAPAVTAAEPPQADTLDCPKNLPQFEDYPVDSVYHGQPRWPAITLGPDSQDLANRPEAALAYVKDHTPDFAGHLHVVESGCGAPCQVQQFVDVQTGEVVGSAITSLGARYHVGSRLFIANPMNSTGCYSKPCGSCRPRYLVWNGQGLDSIW